MSLRRFRHAVATGGRANPISGLASLLNWTAGRKPTRGDRGGRTKAAQTTAL